MRLLIAEDEKDLNRILCRKLTEEGYSIDSCFDGEEALYYLESGVYDGALLDIMMPRMDGFEVLRNLRAQDIPTPVLFLTARDSISDRVKGLDLGASDYLIKPFSMEELLARVRVLTRESFGENTSVLSCGDLTLDTASHAVRRGGKEISLTAKEFALLEYLMMNQGRVLSREQIESHIWNYDYEGGSNVVDVYIRYLRRKVDDGFPEPLIQTVRGSGYMLKAEEGGDY